MGYCHGTGNELHGSAPYRFKLLVDIRQGNGLRE